MKFLFDLGGVFFDWNPEYFFKNKFKSKQEMKFFLKKVCNNRWNLKQDAGRKIADAEKELIMKFPEYSNEIKMYYPNNHNMILKVFLESVNVLEMLLKKNYSCYVLSNWSAETFLGMKEKYPFLTKFDGMIISGKVKLIKPDKEIYKLAITRFNLIPEKTVFIDDKLENIISAKKLNFQTIHLKNAANIMKNIKKFI